MRSDHQRLVAFAIWSDWTNRALPDAAGHLSDPDPYRRHLLEDSSLVLGGKPASLWLDLDLGIHSGE